MINTWIKKNVWAIAGIVLGAIAGFLYWNYIGCVSGQCAITSVWYNSTIYGAIMGGLLGSSFTTKEVKPKKETESHDM